MARKLFLLLAVIGVMAAFNCSHKTTTPTVPDSSFLDLPTPQINDVPGRTLLGTWTITFDTENLDFEINSSRISEMHYNATQLIPAPEVDINDFNPITNIIDVDVTITNPYPVDVYDVRLIIYTDSVGHKLQNDDGWTALYEIPGGLPINPFKAYAKSVPDRLFAGEVEHTENLQIFLPGGNPNVTFAIDASYPGNCEEPHKIGNLSQEVLYDVIGSSAIIQVGVYDWQNDVSHVNLYCPAITGTTVVPFHYIGYNGWEMELVNNTGASSGEYPGFIIAVSENSGSLALYEDVLIAISPESTGWARTWGGTEGASGTDVATDASGNIYVAGYFKEIVDFDPGPEEDWHFSNGSYDIYLSKFDTKGNFVWARTWGWTDNDTWGGLAVDTDDSGNIYVTGPLYDLMDLDPGPGEDWHASNGEADIYLSKFDTSGNFIWACTWGGSLWDTSKDLTADGSGNILVTGFFKDIVDFDPGPGEDWHTSNGGYDIFLSKFDTNGNLVWACTWGGSGNRDWGKNVAADDSGNILVSGAFKGSVDFDPGPEEDWHHAHDNTADLFLSKFKSDGDFIWARTWGSDKVSSASYDTTDGMATDSSENIYVTGYFYKTVDFDPGPGEDEHTSNGSCDIFLSKFDTNGDFILARTWGGTDLDQGYDIATDNSGNIYVSGRFEDVVDFDPGPGVDERTSVWNPITQEYCWDMFLSKFDSNGEFIWACTLGGISGEVGSGVTTYNDGNNRDIFVTGYFSDVVDFNPGPGEDWHYSSAGNAFLIKYRPNGYWE